MLVEIRVMLRTCQAEVATRVPSPKIGGDFQCEGFGCGALGFASSAGGHGWAAGVKHQSDLI